jgi:serine/threonine-protein kinase
MASIMSAADYSGRTLDNKYHLTRLLGRGGMGSVYRGEHIIIGKKVAVKFLHSEFAHNEEVVKRFYREAQAAASIGHSAIIDVLDVGVSPEGEPYLVMEYLEGESLGDMLTRTGPLDTGAACGIMEPSLQALQAAHSAGIIHRDLKPDNIFIVRQPSGPPKIKLIDFGISKFVESAGGEKLTQTGSVMGTPAYMSPEQARGSSSLDYRADLYSMGVILYEMLTGQLPFKGANFTEIIISILTELPTPPAEAYERFPNEAEAVLLKSLAKNPGDRYQTAAEFIEALKLLQGFSVRQDNLTRVAAAAEHVTFAGGNLGDVVQDSGKDSSRLAADVLSQVAKRAGTPAGWSGTNMTKPRSGGRMFILVGAIAALITAGGVIAAVILSSGPSGAVVPAMAPADLQPQLPETVSIEVAGAPPGARIFFDDVLVTNNPFKVKRADTGTLVRVELEGFAPFVASVVPHMDQKIPVAMAPAKAAGDAEDEDQAGSSKRKYSKTRKSKTDAAEAPPPAIAAPQPPPATAPEPKPDAEPPKPPKKNSSLQKGAKGTKMADTFE